MRGVGLSRERVLAAALAIVDAEGVDGLTMRRLGRECGVEAMSLYRHVANKDDVLAGLREQVWEGVLSRMRRTGVADRRVTLRTYADALLEPLLVHPGLAPVVLATGAEESQVRVNEELAGRLRAAGAQPLAALAVIQLITSFVLGTAALAGIPGGPWEEPEGASVIPDLLADDSAWPGLAWLRTAEGGEGGVRETLGRLYDEGLEMILDGIEARDQGPRPA
ncbi:transcriptional regulator, TetR family [Beutenbergia cavernae DSM 12333]|uniref:Transcriptional regulator, TetR family n=1 Tax=Beutenbergia cavernae (strain ATCC BAA-8 / DSM 12333 / CCUG 43141 / JCM 11478 / NBRC 16432 / NCIMB 13614 / HKI 0122) TaxID=471853 RepID=C5BWR4_BEUC1|nr:TetR family transcriptional regulator [Beutenbergia cavernae]ACQ80730.1 transcriptional regulator, TetR family [Beutenbergia cavernae DSM 12333]